MAHRKLLAIVSIILMATTVLSLYSYEKEYDDEKTTTLNIQVYDDDSFFLDISHRYYKEIKLTSNGEFYLRFLFTLKVEDVENNVYTLKTMKESEAAEGTAFEVELDKLPSGCRLSTKYIIIDNRGGVDDNKLQFAMVAKLEAGKDGWTILNPKASVKNLLLYFRKTPSYWNSPIIQLRVQETLLTHSEYQNWLNSLAPPPPPEPIRIGVIFPDDDGLATDQHIIRFAEEDIESYYQGLGVDVDFEFMMKSASGQPSIHLEKVQYFDQIGVNLLLGGAWSGQAMTCLDYCNENDILLFSPSSTSPYLSIPGDNLFRLSPDDNKQSIAIAELMKQRGKDAIVIIHRSDSWGNNLADAVAQKYKSIGGAVLNIHGYDPQANDFTDVLGKAEQDLQNAIDGGYNVEDLAIELISFQEASIILNQAKGYATVYSVIWYGSEGTVHDQNIMNNAPDAANHTKLFSPMASPADSQLYNDLNQRYKTATGKELGFYGANYYDICWIYAKAIIEAGTTETAAIKSITPDIAQGYIGASGNCTLDVNGDRYYVDYDIWGYAYDENGNIGEKIFGKYITRTNHLEWYDEQ